MGVKLTEWRLRMSDNILSTLSKADKAFDNTRGKAKGLQNTLSGEKFQSFSGEIPALSRGANLLSNGYILAGAGVAAFGTALYKSAVMGLEYEEQMAKINATTQLTAPELLKLKNELIEIGVESGKNFDRIPTAFERINSSINNTNESLDLLKLASKGSLAGFADIDVVGGSLAQTKSVLGNKASGQEIMDMMFGAKKAGNAEFIDIANYLPSLIAGGDNLKMNYKDVAGMFSFFTGKVSASESAMFMQNAFTAFGKGDIQKEFEKQGINLFDKQGNMRDVGVFFQELQTKTKRLSAQGKSNFLEAVGLKDAQAKNAFSIMIENADQLRKITEEVRGSAGEMEKQLDATANKARTWSNVGNVFKTWGLELSNVVLPVVHELVSSLDDWIKYFGGKMGWQKAAAFNKDEELAREYAKNKVLEKFPMFGPAMFENKGAKLEGKAAEIYRYNYNWDIAKLTGTMFGGDYDKWLSEERLKPKTPTLAEAEAQKKAAEEAERKRKQKELKNGIDRINEGGRSVRIINVHFNKLNENINIHPQTLKEGTNEVAADLTSMLVRAISGAEESMINE